MDQEILILNIEGHEFCKDNLLEMAARKFFAELFGSKSQVQVTTEVNDEKRRVSISNSGRFRQRNKRRKELQKDTFTPHSPISIDCSREIENSLQHSDNIQKASSNETDIEKAEFRSANWTSAFRR